MYYVEFKMPDETGVHGWSLRNWNSGSMQCWFPGAGAGDTQTRDLQRNKFKRILYTVMITATQPGTGNRNH